MHANGPTSQKKALFLVWVLSSVLVIGGLGYTYVILGNLFVGVLTVLAVVLALGVLNYLLWGRALTPAPDRGRKDEKQAPPPWEGRHPDGRR